MKETDYEIFPLSFVQPVILGIIVFFAFSMALFLSFNNKDKESDLQILTDTKTGCQYLTTKRGGLTPRSDKAGHPICTLLTQPTKK